MPPTSETEAFLEWLADDHFTFLGYREYDLVEDGGDAVLEPVDGSGLGILRDAAQQAADEAQPEGGHRTAASRRSCC